MPAERVGMAQRGYRMLGLVLIVTGVFYLLNPMMFRRGIWLKWDIVMRDWSDDNFIKCMRIMGIILIVVGLGLTIRATLH
ncbi:uncharacterized protein YjeT (DUF2065 family) [Bradyrhizobium sp. USDA 4452]